jgi:hypothetical protein
MYCEIYRIYGHHGRSCECKSCQHNEREMKGVNDGKTSGDA